MRFFKRKSKTPANAREDAERGYVDRAAEEDDKETDADKEDETMEDDEKIVTPDDLENQDENEDDAAAPEDEPDYKNMTEEEFADYIERMRSEDGLEPAFPPAEADVQDEAEEDEEDKPPLPGGAGQPDNSAAAKPEPWRTFATEADYRADVDKAIAEALKQRDLDTAAQRARYERMERISKGFYPDDEGGFDKVADELEEQLAKINDMSIDDYRSQQDMRDKAAKWDEHEKQKQTGLDEKDALINKWVTDAGNLMRLYPDFSLEDALKNEEFADELKTGGDMFSAYAKVYLKDGGKGEPDNPPAAEKREPIPQNASSKRRGTGMSTEDYSKMSSKEFRKRIREMRDI